jgi:hypothetical protein
MSGGGGSAPKPDPNIGIAALRSADLGEEYLSFMKDQGDITNAWAEQDRSRYRTVFEPLQDEFIAEARAYDTPGRRAGAAREAVGDVRQQFAAGRDARARSEAAAGVTPGSGRSVAGAVRDHNAEALAAAGASNLARRRTEATGLALRGDAINLGSGLGVNPATSMGLSNNAAGSGFSGAMRGQAQMGSMLGRQDQMRMQTWQSNVNQTNQLLGGLGMLGGALISSKDAKTDKSKLPAMSALDAVESMPVEKWRYKKGVADEGEHIGPYAEDFKRETGQGDGKTISVMDAIGVTMGAVQDLSKKVDKMEAR